MGTEVVALITEWEPMVADFRTAPGLGVYRGANAAYNAACFAAQAAGRPAPEPPEQLLPYAVERPYWGGSSFLDAAWDATLLLPLLPADVRVPVSALLDMVYREDPLDDLSQDAGGAADADVFYAMRPETTRLARARAGAVPWDTLCEVAAGIPVPEPADDRYTPDFGSVSTALVVQRDWIVEAATTGRGIVVIVSQ